MGKRNDKKDMNKVRCFACHKTDHYASQCLKRKKKKPELEVSASTESTEFVEKYEKDFSLMTGPMGSGCLVFKDVEVWFVENGASRHMTRMRLVFLSFLEIELDCYVGCGDRTRHAMKGVIFLRFHLELRVFLEVNEALFVPDIC